MLYGLRRFKCPLFKCSVILTGANSWKFRGRRKVFRVSRDEGIFVMFSYFFNKIQKKTSFNENAPKQVFFEKRGTDPPPLFGGCTISTVPFLFLQLSSLLVCSFLHCHIRHTRYLYVYK